MTDYGVTALGFVRKPLPVILDEMAARQRADIDPAWDTESDSLAGQYNGIIGDELAQLWEVLEAISNSLDRGQAEDAALDAIGDLTGTPRLKATKSQTTLQCTLTSGTLLPAGSVVSVAGIPSVRFVTKADFTAPSSGTFPVASEAETAGPVLANAGTLTVIETSVSGWSAVTNPSDAIPGKPVETNPQYRLRQILELAAPGGGTIAGIKADLQKVSGVTAVNVLENKTGFVVDTMPPHSFEPIVAGGADADVATAIWNDDPAGIASTGNTHVTITDSAGVAQVVYFTRPVARRVYVAVLATSIAGADHTALATAIANAIQDATLTRGDAGFLDVGDDVYASRLVCVTVDVPGVVDAQVGVSFSSIGVPSSGSSSLTIAVREIATISNADVVVTCT